MSSIVRVNKTKNYSVISNQPLNDTRLTWEARGVLAYLLSKPDGWECRNYDLINNGPSGKHVIQRVLRELQGFGYLYRYRTSDGPNKIKWVTEIYETPDSNPHLSKADFSTIEDLEVEDLEVEKSGHIVSTDSIVNTDLEKVLTTTTKDTGKIKQIGKPQHTNGATHKGGGGQEWEDLPPLDPDYAEVTELYENEIGSLTPFVADMVKDDLETYPKQWLLDGIHIAAEANARNWRYVRGILKTWKTKGRNAPKDSAPQKQAVVFIDTRTGEEVIVSNESPKTDVG